MSVEIESIEHELEESIASLRQAGVRITPQRQAILRYLISSHTHPTADEIYQALSPDFPNISVATIYNNLRVFKDIGIVKELTYGDSSSRFDFNTHNHYHIICEQCGKIVDFQYPQLNEIERLACGYSFGTTNDKFYSVCQKFC